MGHGAWFVAGWVTIVVAGTSTEASAQSQPIDLSRLVADLNLTWGGTAKWLKLLEAQEHGPSVERLVAVTPTGEPLMERDGEASSVSLGSELDLLLRRQGRSVVLIHNHPTGVGLSAADIGHLAKPGLAAIVALGHEGSVFIAAAGPALDGDSLAEQIAIAQAAVRERLRADGASVPARSGSGPLESPRDAGARRGSGDHLLVRAQ